MIALSNSNRLLKCGPESNTTGMPEGSSSLFVCDCEGGFYWLINAGFTCSWLGFKSSGNSSFQLQSFARRM